MHFIIENHINSNGTVDSTTTARSSFALALSYYYERCSKMVATELYPKVAVMLCDSMLNVIEHKEIDTLYSGE